MSEKLSKKIRCNLDQSDYMMVKMGVNYKYLELSVFSDFNYSTNEIELSPDKVAELIDFLQQCKTHLEQQQ